uniref:Sialate O-acetylesterase domain-containing protein n=1 Tax=Davidia involucrata TaxID=16924 RepID=A0A5B7C9U5_DAVIN
MMLSLLSLLLLAHVWLVIPSRSPDDIIIQKNIFILAGQSNMAGRGGVVNNVWDGIVPPECQPKPSILRLSAGLVWQEAHEPLHADNDFNRTCGVGPGMAFANAVLENDSSFGVLGLVPCAVGGTGISKWSRGTSLYNDLVRRAEVALLDGGTIRGILWYQGENDTISRIDADLYKQRLEKFFLDLRTDLQSPLLPIFQVALASGQGPFKETVREAQLGINLPNVICVDAKGLPLEPDGLHLSTRAQVRLGEMLADAFLQTIPSPILNNAPRRFTYSVSNFLIGLLFTSLLVILTVDQSLMMQICPK